MTKLTLLLALSLPVVSLVSAAKSMSFHEHMLAIEKDLIVPVTSIQRVLEDAPHCLTSNDITNGLSDKQKRDTQKILLHAVKGDQKQYAKLLSKSNTALMNKVKKAQVPLNDEAIFRMNYHCNNLLGITIPVLDMEAQITKNLNKLEAH